MSNVSLIHEDIAHRMLEDARKRTIYTVCGLRFIAWKYAGMPYGSLSNRMSIDDIPEMRLDRDVDCMACLSEKSMHV